MDKALKQRLVGASVLIVLTVIVLPMLLGGRSDRLKHESRQIELPQQPDELSFTTRRFPVGVSDKVPLANNSDSNGEDEAEAQTPEQEPLLEQPDPGAASTQTPPVPDTDPVVVEPGAQDSVIDGSTDEAELAGNEAAAAAIVKPPAVTTVLIKPEPVKTVTPEQPGLSPGGTPRYLVQVASFSSEKRANALADELRAANMTVVMDVVDRTAGRLHRVRVGPFVERSRADAIIARIRTKDDSLSPRVLDMRPGDGAPASGPSDPMVRWVVQIGSYSKAESADAQVAKLRLAGLPAFTEKVSSAKGTSYKVRVGPELDPGKARALARKIKAEHHIDGFVTTQ